MSGSLVSTGLGLLSALQSGSGVTLGTVTLTGMATPERMPFGGSQAMVVHKFPGGGRVIQSLGPDDRDIEWSATLIGSDAVSLARQIDAMRSAGFPVTLAWADFSRQVVIGSFEPDFSRGGAVVPYRIRCVVASSAGTSGKPTLLGSLASDLASSLGLEGLDGLASEAQSALALAQRALPVAAVLTRGSSTYTGLATALGAANTAVGVASSVANGSLGGILGSPGAGTFGAAEAAAASDAQGALSAATNAASYVGRALKNMANGI